MVGRRDEGGGGEGREMTVKCEKCGETEGTKRLVFWEGRKYKDGDASVLCLKCVTEENKRKRVSNKKLNRAMLIMAMVLNSFLVWIYWIYAPTVLAQEEEDK